MQSPVVEIFRHSITIMLLVSANNSAMTDAIRMTITLKPRKNATVSVAHGTNNTKDTITATLDMSTARPGMFTAMKDTIIAMTDTIIANTMLIAIMSITNTKWLIRRLSASNLFSATNLLLKLTLLNK